MHPAWALGAVAPEVPGLAADAVDGRALADRGDACPVGQGYAETGGDLPLARPKVLPRPRHLLWN